MPCSVFDIFWATSSKCAHTLTDQAKVWCITPHFYTWIFIPIFCFWTLEVSVSWALQVPITLCFLPSIPTSSMLLQNHHYIAQFINLLSKCHCVLVCMKARANSLHTLFIHYIRATNSPLRSASHCLPRQSDAPACTKSPARDPFWGLPAHFFPPSVIEWGSYGCTPYTSLPRGTLICMVMRMAMSPLSSDAHEVLQGEK